MKNHTRRLGLERLEDRFLLASVAPQWTVETQLIESQTLEKGQQDVPMAQLEISGTARGRISHIDFVLRARLKSPL